MNRFMLFATCNKKWATQSGQPKNFTLKTLAIKQPMRL